MTGATWWRDRWHPAAGHFLQLDLAGLVARLAAGDGGDPARPKARLPQWAWGRFESGYRAARAAQWLGGLVLDVDRGSWAEAIGPWTGWEGAAVATPSYRPEAPRLRVLLPFARPVPPAEYDRAWRWAASRCPADRAGRTPAAAWLWGPRPARVERWQGPRLEPSAWAAVAELRRPRPRPTADAGAEYGAAVLEAEAARVAKAPEGERQATLNARAWWVGGLVSSGAIGEVEAARALLAGARACGLVEELGELECSRIIARAFRQARPRGAAPRRRGPPPPREEDRPPWTR
jgi:hypothetical protein